MSKIVANILCHNDLIYLRNLIPLVKKFTDHIIVVDDLSTDGSREFLKMQGVELIERKFDLNFSNQRNAALQLVDNGDWVFRIDSDEIPSDGIVNNLRQVLGYFESRQGDRVSVPIFHMINFDMCKLQLGLELRLFRKNASCVYQKKFHEEIHGEFPKDTTQFTFPEHYCLTHWKYADKTKVDYTKSFFLENRLYEAWDLQERLDMESTFLPPQVKYSMIRPLREYLCTNNIYTAKG